MDDIANEQGPRLSQSEGGLIPGSGAPAFTLHIPQNLSIPLVICVPHAGRAYPDAIVGAMREPQWSKLRLEDRYVDLLAKQVAEATGAALLMARAPRAMLDLNRSPEDVDWEMIEGAGPRRTTRSYANRRARGGLGIVPRRLPGLGEIWNSRLNYEELNLRIENIHRPYHAALTKLMEEMRDRWGAATLVDLHSMPPLRPVNAKDKPAELVIGDRFGSSCHELLSDTALRLLGRAGKRVAHNRPYSGGYVLDHHSAPRRNLYAMQIEICRSLYLDAHFEELSSRNKALVPLLSELVRELGTDTLSLAGPMRQAAE